MIATKVHPIEAAAELLGALDPQQVRYLAEHQGSADEALRRVHDANQHRAALRREHDQLISDLETKRRHLAGTEAALRKPKTPRSDFQRLRSEDRLIEQRDQLTADIAAMQASVAYLDEQLAEQH